MLTTFFNLLSTSTVDTATAVGGYITLAIDILCTIIILIKALKDDNLTLKEAFLHIFTIFYKHRNRDNSEDNNDAENDYKEDK